MFGIHRHQFVERERFYEPGLDITRIRNCSPSDMKNLISGITTIHSQCRICGKDRYKDIYGKSLPDTVATDNHLQHLRKYHEWDMQNAKEQ